MAQTKIKTGLIDGPFDSLTISGDLTVDTNTLFVDSTNNRVGVGTTSPSRQLTVENSGNAILSIKSGTTANSFLLLGDTDADNIGMIKYDNSNNQLEFFANSASTQRLVIANNGNAAIGTTTATAGKLSVIDSGGGGTATHIASGTTSSQIRFKAHTYLYNGIMSLYDSGGTEDVKFNATNGAHSWINNGGNVGIGTSSPQAKLQVSDTSTDLQMRIGNLTAGLDPKVRFQGKNVANTANRYADIQLDAENGLLTLIAPNTSNPTIKALSVKQGGNVLIGRTNDAFTDNGHVLFPSGASYQIRDGGPANYLKRKSSNGEITRFYRDSTQVGNISVTTSSTSYNTSSDHRLKENVVDLTGALDRVDDLNPKRFNFIADSDTTVDGFLAHEVQTVVPEAVTGTHNEVDENGDAVYQGIDQSKLVPLLTAALQEAHTLIKDLTARIETLENQ